MREAVEDNLREFLLRLGEAGGGEQRRDDVLDWTIGGSPIDYQNAVIPRRGVTDADIALSIARFRHHGVPGSWHVFDDDALCDRLLAHGFTGGHSEAGMAVATRDLAPADSPAVIEEVLTPAQLAPFVTLLEGFGIGPPEAHWVGEMHERLGYGPGKPWRHYLARLDGAPVATATALSVDGVCGLYFVFTAPEARNRGIGAAITRHAAADSGCALAVLGASTMGEPVYRRLGFVTACRPRVLEFHLGSRPKFPCAPPPARLSSAPWPSSISPTPR